MNCPDPIDPAILADYWLGLLPAPEESLLEEHLLGCDGCAARLRETIALAEAIRRIAGEGSLRMIVTDTFVSCAAERGLRIRQYAPPAGGSVACTVGPADDLLISRLVADLASAARVDLSFCDESGVEQARLRDIPFRADAGAVLCQESITFARALPATMLRARLIALGASGETLLGEYTFNHTPTLPRTGVADESEL